MSTSGTIAPSAGAGRNLFAADIFQKIVNERTQENVVFSPASIHSCITLAFLGASGQTAEEMREGLKLTKENREAIAQQYGDFLRTQFKSRNSIDDDNEPKIRMANRIYVNDKLEIADAFNNLAKQYFDSEAEKLPFADGVNSEKKINTWVEEETENKIKNLLQPGSISGDTSAILVNAIYFKAKWLKPFSQSSTHKEDFSINANQKVSVDMMYMDERLHYADLPELNAKALKLPYKNTELHMLLILPNQVDGLKELENQLATVDLNDITNKMQIEDVDVLLPKFRIELDVDLKQPLQELGMAKMFSNNAEFTDLFVSDTPQKISDARHKAYLDVNEAGSEAAAATYLKIVPMSLNLQQKSFKADHPFVFAIRNSASVFFMGHVAKF